MLLLTPRKKNVSFPPLVEPEDVVMPSIDIKLGLIKNFVIAMDKVGEEYLYLKEKSP